MGRFTVYAARSVAAFGPAVRFGPRTPWGAVTDGLDHSMPLAAQYAGGGAARDAALLLSERLGWPTSGTGTQRIAGDRTRRRESCRFHHLIKDAEEAGPTGPRVLRKCSGRPDHRPD